MTAITMEPATIRFLDRANRGILPDYNSPSCREGWIPRRVAYSMDDGRDDIRRNRSVTAAILGGGAAALACMAQHYGALDSNIVSGAMDMLGSVGTSIAATLPTYVSARLVQG